MNNPNDNAIPIYDLSGDQFQFIQITTIDGREMKGQFVQFIVIKDFVEHYYPRQELCFLPQKHKKEFWNSVNSQNGKLTEIPQYLLFFSLDELSQITIFPIKA